MLQNIFLHIYFRFVKLLNSSLILLPLTYLFAFLNRLYIILSVYKKYFLIIDYKLVLLQLKTKTHETK
jgi:hypothetical protein